MKRWLFFCDTTYQLYNIVTIIAASNEHIEADLVMKHGFTNSYKYITRAIQERLFDHVYTYSIDQNRSRISAKVEDIRKLILSKNWLKKNLNFVFQEYERFYAANLDDNVALALYATVPFKEFCLFEDGTGSYHGDIINDYMSWKRRSVLKCLHPGKRYFKVDRMLLYAPEISVSSACEKKERLQATMDDRVQSVFEYRDMDLYNNKIVFLDQSYAMDRPAEITAKRKEQDRFLEEYLSPFFDNLVMRPHPRMLEGSVKVKNIDTTLNLWEMECVRKITDKHVLISIYSSAAFQPVLLSQNRPTLIFLYKIYNFLYSSDQLLQINEHIRRFTDKFNYKNIYIPENWEEFKSCIEENV